MLSGSYKLRAPSVEIRGVPYLVQDTGRAGDMGRTIIVAEIDCGSAGLAGQVTRSDGGMFGVIARVGLRSDLPPVSFAREPACGTVLDIVEGPAKVLGLDFDTSRPWKVCPNDDGIRKFSSKVLSMCAHSMLVQRR